MDINLQTALIGAGASALVAAAVYFGQLQQAKWSATMAMVNEFNSPPMIAARGCAHKFLVGKTERYDEIELFYGGPENEQNKNAVWLVHSFYERLAILIKRGKLSSKMAGAIFGEIFLWWWGFSFENQQPEHWSASKHVRWLRHWMGRYFASENQPDRVPHLIQLGRNARIGGAATDVG